MPYLQQQSLYSFTVLPWQFLVSSVTITVPVLTGHRDSLYSAMCSPQALFDHLTLTVTMTIYSTSTDFSWLCSATCSRYRLYTWLNRNCEHIVLDRNAWRHNVLDRNAGWHKILDRNSLGYSVLDRNGRGHNISDTNGWGHSVFWGYAPYFYGSILLRSI